VAGQRARQLDSRLTLLEGQLEAGEALGRALERLNVGLLGGESGGLGALQPGKGQEVVAAEHVRDSLERVHRHSRAAGSFARELDGPAQGEQRGLVGVAVACPLEPLLEALARELELAAGEVKADHRCDGAGTVLIAAEQLRGLL
jgi:hypothetical protein